MKGRVLVVAGSDSGGGAGIQADIKTVTALGGFAASAITALTAQNTETVTAVHVPPPDFVAEQMRVVLSDIGADCIKTGMMHSEPIIDAVAEVLATQAVGIPVVVDPVLISKSGAALLEDSALHAFKAWIVLRAALITPNIPEAETLTGLEIHTVDDMRHAAEMLFTLGAPAVLVKGGHLAGNKATDVLLSEDGEVVYESERINSRSTHGTGCTLASGIATGIAQGLSIPDAVARARTYLRAAIINAPGYGRGHGPLDHGVTVGEIPDL